MNPTPNTQEIFLLERYISAEYFCELRDTWAEMVKHLENCLDRCMLNLPKNYRARPLPEQPDVVWGSRVIPNFRKTLESLHSGYIMLTHRDFLGLTCAWGPESDFKGQMDYWSGWMARADENVYGELLSKALTLASNISRTERAGWEPFELSGYGDYLGPLNPPTRWPTYRLNANSSVSTGQHLEQSGIYVPDVEGACAQFLFVRYETAPATKVRVGMRPILHPTTGEQYDEEPILENRNCTWYPIERVSDEQDDARNDLAGAVQRIRVPAGQACPETGFYFTPAKTQSRRLFRTGEVMPSVDSDYGQTFWQWHSDQTS